MSAWLSVWISDQSMRHALALLSAGRIDHFYVPLWVKLASALTIGLGTFSGGKRIIRTLGMRLVKLQPIDGFAAETAV